MRRDDTASARIVWRRLRVLVTGGAGFIGSHLVVALLRRGDEVRVLDNFSTGFRHNLAVGRRRVRAAGGRPALLRARPRRGARLRRGPAPGRAALGPALRAGSRSTSSEINIGGTLNVLLTARDEGVRRVVVASSSSVYGDTPGLPRVETMAASPLAPYAVAKLAAEQYALSFNRVYGLETVALRYFNVFGPRQDPSSQYSAVIPKFIVALKQGLAPLVHGDGEQSRDFTFIDDVVQANLLAIEAPEASGRAYNVACGQQRSLNDLIAILNRMFGTEIEPVHGPPRAGDVKHSLADISLARRLLGYEPSVDFEDGLERTAQEYSPVPASWASGDDPAHPLGRRNPAEPREDGAGRRRDRAPARLRAPARPHRPALRRGDVADLPRRARRRRAGPDAARSARARTRCRPARVMERLEPIIVDWQPDLVLVPGDVNSTLAAALTASKLGVRVGHVEAGLRSFDRTMPEEINRILTDQLSDLLFTHSPEARGHLLREGCAGGRDPRGRQHDDRHARRDAPADRSRRERGGPRRAARRVPRRDAAPPRARRRSAARGGDPPRSPPSAPSCPSSSPCTRARGRRSRASTEAPPTACGSPIRSATSTSSGSSQEPPAC